MSATLNGRPVPRQGRATEVLVYRMFERCDWGELQLMRYGWTPDRLQREARKIANDYIALNVPYIGERREDLVSFLIEKALAALPRFRPDHPTLSYGSNGGRHFDSWICDVMANRCVDWYRRKSEGFGDRRYGNDNRVDLSDDPDPADHDTDFQVLVDDRRRAIWQQAADMVDWELDEWIMITLDRAAKDLLEYAA